jgi:glycosyltransferase involved in cell wall biosynthesis
LVLVKGLGIGGAEKLITEGARFWNRDQFSYTVGYALPWKDALVPSLEALGIDVLMLGSTRGMTLSFPPRLRSVIKERDIDLVHAHLPTMGIAARLVSPVPVVYTEHNVAHSYRAATRALNRATYFRNTAVIAVSDAVAESVAPWPGPGRRVIRNGVSVSVDPEDARVAREELGLDDGALLIAHVGNIRPGKGHDNLIEAVADLSSRRSDFMVVSIGVEKYEGDLERVRSKADQLGLSERIRFLGRRPDALSFVAAADLFVNPSEVEGLPVAVLEAMALRIPVVATAAGGVPAIVRGGETGSLVEASDPLALAKAMDQLLDDRSLASELAAAAGELIDSDYSLDSMIQATEDVYREVLHA